MSAPAYDSYKESGVDWLGEVPSHWRITRVKDICEILNGFPFDSKLFDPEVGQPLVRIRDLNAVEAEVRFAGPSSDRYLVTSRELLIGMDGDFNVGRWRGLEPALLNQRVCALKTHSETMSKLLEYGLANPLQRINDFTYSTTVKHLSAFQVGAIRLAVPPGDELPKLIDFLDRETGKIDALVEAQTRLIELLKEKRQAVISHAVTKGLDPAAPMKNSGVEWLGHVPAHWKTLRFSRHFKIGMGQTLLAEDLVGGGAIPVFSATEDDRYFGYIDAPNLTLTVGDLVIPARGNSIGHVKLVREIATATQTTIYAKAADLSVTLPEYVFWFLKAHRKRLFPFTRTAIPQITTAEVGANPLLLPPISEQAEVARFARNADSRFAALMSEAERAIALLQERRAALISAAVTGKIDVRGLAPEQAEAA